MNNSNERIKEVAKAAVVSEYFLCSFINSPIDFLLWSGSYWYHINNQRNSQSKLLDKWVDSSLEYFFETHRDPLGSRIYSLNFKKNYAIQDIVTQHIHNKFLLRLDISKYFETISFNMVEDKLPESLKFLLKPIYLDSNNTLRRGLHASPRIAEIVGKRIDNKIKYIIFRENLTSSVKYTRYCDDLQFSSDNRVILRSVEAFVRQEMKDIGLAINEDKTKIIPVNSNQILGLRIHDGKIIVSKRYRNRARIRFFIAQKSYNICNKKSKDSLLETIQKIESAIGTLNYLIQHGHGDKYKKSVDILVIEMNELKQIYNRLVDNGPLLDTITPISHSSAKTS